MAWRVSPDQNFETNESCPIGYGADEVRVFVGSTVVVEAYVSGTTRPPDMSGVGRCAVRLAVKSAQEKKGRPVSGDQSVCQRCKVNGLRIKTSVISQF
ncbi:MAG: hypothetical protein UY21_C0014G0021 [Microgenomates group bacterium GW2011_GWA1_48_10]|nr:MAG: hypothetical protein UY21_C0014G0021 [Microgenomates group bacterium GW2011_GWA1_48_10]